MFGLITDRGQSNVDRHKALAAKGWSNMTPAEQAEWSGDPLLADRGANLLPQGENYTTRTSVLYHRDSIRVTANGAGKYLYAVLAVGPAANFEGKTMTLSLDSVYSSGGTPNIALYWHDSDGYEIAGGGLTEPGSVTFPLRENTAGRETLAVYLYASTSKEIVAGDYIQYRGLMLEFGSVRHEYVPYYEVLPTPATKGAYNYSDLNRVERVVASLAETLGLSLVTKTDWTAWDLPKQADMKRFLDNINALRRVCPLAPDVPATPESMQNLTFVTANNIEKIVGALAESTDSVFRAGELYAGEV